MVYSPFEFTILYTKRFVVKKMNSMHCFFLQGKIYGVAVQIEFLQINARTLLLHICDVIPIDVYHQYEGVMFQA